MQVDNTHISQNTQSFVVNDSWIPLMNMEIGSHFLVYCVWIHGEAKTIITMMRFKVSGSDADDCYQIMPSAYIYKTVKLLYHTSIFTDEYHENNV